MSPTAIVAEKYKVKDLSLAEWGRGRKSSSQKMKCPVSWPCVNNTSASKTSCRGANRRVSAYDHPDCGVDRNSHRAGRGSTLGLLQYLLDPGSGRGRDRTCGYSRIRLEGRDWRKSTGGVPVKPCSSTSRS